MSEPDEDRSKLVANERSKLTATYVNGLAIALFAVGGLAPMFARRGASPGDVGRSWLTLSISLLC
ncbi:amino acid transporter [Methylobacterium marchantiae]|uniref:Amino acid transporter n=1 Tax=Methylobacterium marchantiae TaxID=600331 RepID=A0ABW3WZW8_9HYPH|nr:hypothetical protein AIGOOFII_0749 [Methylobacterium marchantiae]